MDSQTNRVGDHYPLTKRQQALCWEEDFHPELPVNWVTVQLDINGELNPDLFKTAFDSLCSRYAAFSLRLQCDANGQRYFIKSDKVLEQQFSIVDYSTNNDASYEQWLQQWLNQSLTDNEPLWFAALVVMAPDHYRFYLNLHHIITDGFSCAHFIEKLSEAYTQQPAQNEASEEDGFLEFLQRTTENEVSEQAQQRESYWQQKFSSSPEPSNLYSQSTYLKTAKTISISKQLDAETQALIAQSAAQYSPSILFTAATFVFLHRVTVNKDLVLGVPLLNRSAQEAELLGLFMEVCPNRVQVEPNDTFEQIIAKVEEEISAVKPYRGDFVSAKLAGYEVIMNYHVQSPNQFADIPAQYQLTTPLNLLSQFAVDTANNSWTGKESLSIQIHHDSEQQYRIRFDFNAGVWQSEVLRHNAITHYCNLLRALLHDPTQKISLAPILTDAERLALLPNDDSALAQEKSIPLVIELFRQQAERTPEKVAVVFDEQSISYSELAQKVDRLAESLARLGVKPGVLVGICLQRTPRMLEAMLAVMAAGGAYVPIDPKQPSDRIAIILEDAAPLVVLTENALQDRVTGQDGMIKLCLDTDDISGSVDDKPATQPASSQDLAYVIFTSGSTGRPKGVEVRHHGLTTFLQAMAEQPGMGPNDRVLTVTTISFDIAALELFLPLIVGGSVCIAPYEMTIDGPVLAQRLNQGDITLFQATPATYRLLLSSNWPGNPQLKLMCGGEAMPTELAGQLIDKCASLWNMYGPTETTIWSSVYPVTGADAAISIGRAIPGTQLYVLDSNLQLVPIGVPGELFIAGDGVARGYYNNPTLTNEKFIANPFSQVDNAKMYQTGDLVRLRPDLNLDYISRMDFQVKIRGFRIEVGEIESLLGVHEAVAQCIVKPWPNAQGELALYAYVRLESGEEFDAAALRAYLKTKLPDYMVPSAFVPMQSFPLTPNGKIDRKRLPEPASVEIITDESSYLAPRNDFELSLSAVWRNLLKKDRVGINDNFFDLGGDSLLTVPLVHEMKKATGLEFDIGDIFSCPTIAQLSEMQGQEVAKKAASVVPLQAKGDLPPLFCLCGINLYQDLADQLGENQPVYGIYVAEEQAFLENVMQGRESELSVSQLAARYCDAIRRHQSKGPYQLAGISFGGLLAIETAKLLTSQGEPVEVVVLLDTVLPAGIQRSMPGLVRYKLRKLRDYLRKRLKASANTETHDAQDLHQFREQAFIKTMEEYQHSDSHYSGRVVLMKATDKNSWGKGVRFAPDYGWGKHLSSEMTMHEIPGSHIGIIKKPDVSYLIEKLRPYLIPSATQE